MSNIVAEKDISKNNDKDQRPDDPRQSTSSLQVPLQKVSEGKRASLERSEVEKKRLRIPTESKLSQFRTDPAKNYHLMGVLPSEYLGWVNSDFDLPIIEDMPLNDIYPILAELLECPDYIVNPSTFWYLDILAEALDTAQRETPMDLKEQKLIIAWFGHIMNLFREKTWTREEILSNTQNEILVAGYQLDNFSWVVPAPQQEKNYLMTGTTSRSFTQLNAPKARITMAHIVHLIYDVFANPFQYHLIQNAFFKHPDITDVKMPHTIRCTKSYEQDISEKNIKLKRGSDRRSVTKLLNKQDRQSLDLNKPEELQDNDQYILPLQEAVAPDFFYNLFPKMKSHFGSTTPADT